MSDTTVDYQVLNNILQSLVTVTDKINIDRKVDEMGVLLSVTVDASDMGLLIGRGGVMASSIKTIMKAVGKTNDMNVRVQFLEPDGSVRKRPENNSKPAKSAGGDDNKMREEKLKDAPEVTDIDSELDEFVIN